LITTRDSAERLVDRTQTVESLRLAVGRTARRMRQQAGIELTPSRLSLLNTIASQGPMTPSKLAEAERISRPTVTRMIAKLKAQGLVECVVAPEDGRSYQIALSENGSALRQLQRERKTAYVARLLENADADEIELLNRAALVLLRLVEEEGA
jgi:DNA-binding MarR family transcriptional regulator